MKEYQKDLITCYTNQARHFHHTRKKFWPEVDHAITIIKEHLGKHQDGPFDLLDLGCGAGRLSDLLSSHFPGMNYLGTDNAPGMIEQCKKNYPNRAFRCEDMVEGLRKTEQESLDIIIALASIQHIKEPQEQLILFSHLYKTLKRGGKCILINRSYSDWFIKKYWKYIVCAVGRFFRKKDRSRNDVLIPRKDPDFTNNGRIYKRMYHIYTLHELTRLATLAGFCVEKKSFVGQDGKLTSNRRGSRNSFIVLSKRIG